MKLLEKPTVQGEMDQGNVDPRMAEVKKIDDLKEVIDQANWFPEPGYLDSALQILLDQEAQITQLEARLKDLNQARAIAEQAVIDRMLEQGIENFKALGKSVTKTERVFPSVLKEDRERQYEWLRTVGAGALITETVNSNTFAGFIRNTFIEPKLEASLPDWIKVYRETKLLIRTVSK